MVEFVSYDGEYPCLCFGTLTIKVDGITYRFKNALISGGGIFENDEFDMWAEEGEWEIDLKEHPELEPYKEEITRIINENVEHGCCGGCI